MKDFLYRVMVEAMKNHPRRPVAAIDIFFTIYVRSVLDVSGTDVTRSYQSHRKDVHWGVFRLFQGAKVAPLCS